MIVIVFCVPLPACATCTLVQTFPLIHSSSSHPFPAVLSGARLLPALLLPLLLLRLIEIVKKHVFSDECFAKPLF